MALTNEGSPLPCLNPSCRSHGASHPNCRCYGGMAAGGPVLNYCDTDRAHTPDCPYFADGGQVSEPHHKAGSKLLRDAFEKGLMKGHHPISDSMLGHKDPHHVVAAVVAHGGAPSLLRIGSNGIFTPKESSSRKQTGERSERLLAGLGMASKGNSEDPQHAKDLEEGLEHPWFRKGADMHGKMSEMMANPKEVAIQPMMEKLAGRKVHSAAQSHLVPTTLKLLANGATPDEIEHGISYAEHIGRGVQKIDRAVDSLFDHESKEPVEAKDLKPRAKLHEYIKDGKFHDELMAENTPHPDGEDEGITAGTDAIAKHFPDHNVALQATKARIVNYLNSVRPQDLPALPFDQPFVSKMQQRKYDMALDVANNPLSVISKVKSGTLAAGEIQALGAMYPELYQNLSEKITEKLAESQMDKKLVPLNVRRTMSMFLATPLSATMSPQSIQTIQAIYAKRNQPNPAQQGPPSEKKTSSLTKAAQGSQTNSQALAARQQRAK